MQPIKFDGMEFGPQEIEANREVLIHLRDNALRNGMFAWAVPLSHNIAILAAVIRLMREESNAKNR